MSDLTGNTIASTYKKLLQVETSSNTGLDTTLRNIQSGDGENSALQLATDAVRITTGIAIAGNVSVSSSVFGVGAVFSGTVSAGFFVGDGSGLTNVSSTHPTSVSAFTVNTLGVVSNASVTDITAVTGGFTTKASAAALEVSGVVSGSSAVFSGIVSAAFDGALTGDVTGDLTGDVTGDIDGASGSFSTGISSTDIVGVTGSFTTKVSSAAGEFSGDVSAADVYTSAVAAGVNTLLGKQIHIGTAAVADVVSLTDAATIAVDFNVGQNFAVQLGGNRTLENPTNCVAGQTGSIFLEQDGTGSRTLSYGSSWDFAAGTAPTLTTDGSAIDRLDYIVYTSTDVQAMATLNLS